MKQGKPWKIIKQWDSGFDVVLYTPKGKLVKHVWHSDITNYYLDGDDINKSQYQKLWSLYG